MIREEELLWWSSSPKIVWRRHFIKESIRFSSMRLWLLYVSNCCFVMSYFFIGLSKMTSICIRTWTKEIIVFDHTHSFILIVAILRLSTICMRIVCDVKWRIGPSFLSRLQLGWWLKCSIKNMTSWIMGLPIMICGFVIHH